MYSTSLVALYKYGQVLLFPQRRMEFPHPCCTQGHCLQRPQTSYIFDEEEQEVLPSRPVGLDSGKINILTMSDAEGNPLYTYVLL